MKESASEWAEEALKLQNDIARFLGMDAGNLVFEFSEEADRTQLHLFTINRKHQQRFFIPRFRWVYQNGGACGYAAVREGIP